MKECEYCGDSHDVRDLCAPRRTISRRRFFSLSARAIVGAALAPQIIEAAQSIYFLDPHAGPMVVGGIERATYTFWRNQTPLGASVFDTPENARAAFAKIYNQCTSGPR